MRKLLAHRGGFFCGEHTFALEDLPTALKYARERIEDAIKVVVKTRTGAAQRLAAE